MRRSEEAIGVNVVEWAQKKTDRLDVLDVGLVKLSCIAGGVLLAQLVPSLARVDKRVLAALTLGLAVRPVVRVLGAPRD